MTALSIVFAGTPEFAVPALDALVRARHRVVAVYTQPDRPAGRGQQLTMSAVKQRALRYDLPVEQPATLRDPQTLQQLQRWSPDVMVVVAYGLLLPLPALQTPRLGCINIHASLLPRWRGAAPIQRAILAGDTMTGIAIMRMEEGLDTGPILLERTTPIGARETAVTLHDRLASLGADAVVEALSALATGTVQERAQSFEGVTYAAKLRKDEARIDWTQSAFAIDRQVRAFDPWPVAETRWQGRQLRIWEAVPIRSQHREQPGAVVATSTGGIEVATGEGALMLTRIQLAGRKPVSAAEFARAHTLDGVVLGQ